MERVTIKYIGLSAGCDSTVVCQFMSSHSIVIRPHRVYLTVGVK